MNGESICSLLTTVNNCSEYSLIANECIKCDRDYDLVNNECILHTTIANCIYKQGDACLYCNDSTYSIVDGGLSCTVKSTFNNEYVKAFPPEIYPGYLDKCEHHHQCS